MYFGLPWKSDHTITSSGRWSSPGEKPSWQIVFETFFGHQSLNSFVPLVLAELSAVILRLLRTCHKTRERRRSKKKVRKMIGFLGPLTPIDNASTFFFHVESCSVLLCLSHNCAAFFSHERTLQLNTSIVCAHLQAKIKSGNEQVCRCSLTVRLELS